MFNYRPYMRLVANQVSRNPEYQMHLVLVGKVMLCASENQVVFLAALLSSTFHPTPFS